MWTAVRRAAIAAMMALSVVWLTSDVAYGRQGCVTGFNPTSIIMPPAGTATPLTFTVLTSSDTCTWNFEGVATPNGPFPLPPPWMSYPQPLSGTGSGTVSIGFVTPNTGTAPRDVTFIYGGQTITLTQPVNLCQFTFSGPSPARIPANGGTGTFTVNTAGSGCSYYAFPGDGVTITAGATGGTFPATVGFSVAPNTSGGPLTRAVTVSPTSTPVIVPGVSILQNGPPVATDAPGLGSLFAVHRPATGPAFVSSPEPIRITNAENPTATWTATVSDPWLDVTPATGTSPSTAVISVNPSVVAGLARGTYAATISLSSPVAPSSPLTLRLSLNVTDETSVTTPPFGVVDIPVNGATGLSGAVPVSGWAVDDVGISRVQIYRNAVAGEPAGEIYLGDGTRVRGARPDVVASQFFGFTPGATSAGWGLMVLSNMLPNGGNGTFTLSAYADDVEGRRSLLGRKTVTFDNTGSPFPFGTIDLPGQGATVAGIYNNQGWVLAQPVRSIPFNGSTIRLFIDGVEQPNAAAYGFARPDVSALFPLPTYANANGPAAQFTFDTAQWTDGLHTIVWAVRDDLGVLQGIGSRYINIQNGSASQGLQSVTLEARSAADVRAIRPARVLLWERLGLDEGPWSLRFAEGAVHEIRTARGERVEVALDTAWWSEGCGPYGGYLMTGDVAAPLPAGASLDAEHGLFRWLPPLEFSGTYEFVFVRQACSGREERIPLRLVIGSK